jgi:hypothetical protein
VTRECQHCATSSILCTRRTTKQTNTRVETPPGETRPGFYDCPLVSVSGAPPGRGLLRHCWVSKKGFRGSWGTADGESRTVLLSSPPWLSLALSSPCLDPFPTCVHPVPAVRSQHHALPPKTSIWGLFSTSTLPKSDPPSPAAGQREDGSESGHIRNAPTSDCFNFSKCVFS